MTAPSVTIRRTTSGDPQFVAMTAQLDVELRATYGAVQDAYEGFNVFATETAVVAYANDRVIGCGCMKRFDAEAVELKRVFVAADHRGTGAGRAIVGALEAWAVELGYGAVVLETGTLQTAAIALYERLGYHRTSLWGPYVGLDHSVCMRKLL